MAKGYNPSVSQPDIVYGFKMYRRTEKFNVSLSDINAHTFKIIEIIDEEKSNVEQKPENFKQIGNGF